VTWLTWRQFRVPGLLAVGLLVVLAILLGITGHELRHYYAEYQAQRAACGSAGGDCNGALQRFVGHYHHLYQYLGTILVAIPGVIGVFWGAPLISRELETGTYRLAWTQSVTRTRWLAVKLGLVGLASMLTAGLVSLIVTWWAHPLDHVNGNRFSAEIFSVRGFVPLGYAVFAFALGATLGLLVRRALPAMAATLVIYVAVHLAVIGWVRPHLVPAKHVALSIQHARSLGYNEGPPGTPVHFFFDGATYPGSLVVSEHLVDRAGDAPSGQALAQFVRAECPRLVSDRTDSNGISFSQCLTKLSGTYHLDVALIPGSRYWALQLAETGLYLVVALVLAGGCFWWVSHRLR
jgi:ABC-2 family transporter protein